MLLKTASPKFKEVYIMAAYFTPSDEKIIKQSFEQESRNDQDDMRYAQDKSELKLPKGLFGVIASRVESPVAKAFFRMLDVASGANSILNSPTGLIKIFKAISPDTCDRVSNELKSIIGKDTYDKIKGVVDTGKRFFGYLHSNPIELGVRLIVKDALNENKADSIEIHSNNNIEINTEQLIPDDFEKNKLLEQQVENDINDIDIQIIENDNQIDNDDNKLDLNNTNDNRIENETNDADKAENKVDNNPFSIDEKQENKLTNDEYKDNIEKNELVNEDKSENLVEQVVNNDNPLTADTFEGPAKDVTTNTDEAETKETIVDAAENVEKDNTVNPEDQNGDIIQQLADEGKDETEKNTDEQNNSSENVSNDDAEDDNDNVTIDDNSVEQGQQDSTDDEFEDIDSEIGSAESDIASVSGAIADEDDEKTSKDDISTLDDEVSKDTADITDEFNNLPTQPDLPDFEVTNNSDDNNNEHSVSQPEEIGEVQTPETEVVSADAWDVDGTGNVDIIEDGIPKNEGEELERDSSDHLNGMIEQTQESAFEQNNSDFGENHPEVDKEPIEANQFGNDDSSTVLDNNDPTYNDGQSGFNMLDELSNLGDQAASFTDQTTNDTIPDFSNDATIQNTDFSTEQQIPNMLDQFSEIDQIPRDETFKEDNTPKVTQDNPQQFDTDTDSTNPSDLSTEGNDRLNDLINTLDKINDVERAIEKNPIENVVDDFLKDEFGFGLDELRKNPLEIAADHLFVDDAKQEALEKIAEIFL